MYSDGGAAAAEALRGAPADPAFVFMAGGGWLRAGDYHTVVNQPAAAWNDFQHALDLYQLAERMAPQDRYRNAVAIALSRLGLIASDIDRLAEARSYHDQSLAIRQDLVDRNPATHSYQRGLAAELLLAGAIFSSSQSENLNDPETAIRHYFRGLTIQKALAKADPDDRTNLADLLIVNMRLCETLGLVRPADALPYCAASQESGAASLAGGWRDDVNQYLALADLAEAQARLALKQFAAVRTSAESALHRLEHTGASFVGVDYNRMRAFTLIGDSYTAEGDSSKAAEFYHQALAAAGPSTSAVKRRLSAQIAQRLH